MGIIILLVRKMDDLDDVDIVLKAVIIGESNVGKTKVLCRYVDGTFDDSAHNTVGVDVKIKVEETSNLLIKIHFYDTAGQERFRSIVSKNFKRTDIAVLVYDVSSRESFEKIEYWMDFAASNCPEETVFLLLGNKCDLVEHRMVTFEEATLFAETNNLIFHEVSAKSNENDCVRSAFIESIEKTVAEIAEFRPELLNKDNKGDLDTSRLRVRKEQNDIQRRCCF